MSRTDGAARYLFSNSKSFSVWTPSLVYWHTHTKEVAIFSNSKGQNISKDISLIGVIQQLHGPFYILNVEFFGQFWFFLKRVTVFTMPFENLLPF